MEQSQEEAAWRGSRSCGRQRPLVASLHGGGRAPWGRTCGLARELPPLPLPASGERGRARAGGEERGRKGKNPGGKSEATVYIRWAGFKGGVEKHGRNKDQTQNPFRGESDPRNHGHPMENLTSRNNSVDVDGAPAQEVDAICIPKNAAGASPVLKLFSDRQHFYRHIKLHWEK